MTAFSLSDTALWSQVAALVLDELASYLLPALWLGRPVAMLPPREITGAVFCHLTGGELFIPNGRRRCVSVYGDTGVAALRHIAEGRLGEPRGLAIVRGIAYISERAASSIVMYPVAGGGWPGRTTESWLTNDPLKRPWGVVGWDAATTRVCTCQEGGNRLTLFNILGDEVNSFPDLAHPCGIAAANGMIFVAEYGRVAVLSLGSLLLGPDALELVRFVGEGFLRRPQEVCIMGDLLFVSDRELCIVAVFTVADGRLVGALGEFDAADGVSKPHGVAAREDGALFVTVQHASTWQLYSVSLAL